MYPSRMRSWRDAWTAAIVWGVAAYAIHSVGNHTGLYVEYGWYQNLTHACSASAMAALVAVAGLNRGLSGRRLVAFVILACAVGAVSWEAVEYFGLLDGFGIPLHFHSFLDAAVDMASNVVGVSATLAVVRVTVGLDGDPPTGYSR